MDRYVYANENCIIKSDKTFLCMVARLEHLISHLMSHLLVVWKLKNRTPLAQFNETFLFQWAGKQVPNESAFV